MAFVLCDIEKYTQEEAAGLLMVDNKDIQELLTKAHDLLRISNTSISQVTPLTESIGSLPEQIMPGNEIWKNIFSEIHVMRGNNSVEINNLDSEQDVKQEESKREEKEKKFNFFGWKKK